MAPNENKSKREARTAPPSFTPGVKDVPKQMGLLPSLWHFSIGPLLIMLSVPNLAQFYYYTIVHCNGSVLEFGQRFVDHGFIQAFYDMWSCVTIGHTLMCKMLITYSAWAILLIVVVPAEEYEGPMTEKGNIPIYCDNGFRSYILSTVAFLVTTYILHDYGFSLPGFISDHFGDMSATLSVFSVFFCLFLYVKGKYFPSSTDYGSSGHFIFDYYWGLEHYPRIFGVDIKLFTNCRFGLTIWPLLVWAFSLRSYELHGFVDSVWISAVLQLAYVSKFFWWEAGYMKTMDIAVDRAGFYICWGCLVFVPAVYTGISFYLLHYPVHLGPALGGAILICGLISISLNYIADWQKQHVRDTNGNTTIWGKKPKLIHAKYQLYNGETKESLLLICGWWGVSRHFHYAPEILLSFFWSVPALFTNFLPYFYVIYLTILLVHRSFRDDEKCFKKYGKYWEEYCKAVPYKIIPGIF